MLNPGNAPSAVAVLQQLNTALRRTSEATAMLNIILLIWQTCVQHKHLRFFIISQEFITAQ